MALSLSASANLALCLVTSALAGIGAGLFSCVLSAADKQKRENGGKATRQSRCLMTVGIIGSTTFGIASIAGLFFGPITLVTIIRAGTTLPANAFFSQVFSIRPLIKDDYVGTLACVCGVVCFVCYQGPPDRPPSAVEFWQYFSRPWSIAWNCLLMLFLASASVIVFVIDMLRPPEASQFAAAVFKTSAVGVVIACASSYMDVAIKGWSAAVHHDDVSGFNDTNFPTEALFWVAFVVNVIFLTVMRVGTIYGCAKCDVLLFVPINQVLNVFLSVATGMVVLDEGRNIYSWIGLVFATISVFGGILMLVHGPAEASDKPVSHVDAVEDSRLQCVEPCVVDEAPCLTMGSSGEVWRIRHTTQSSLWFPWLSEVVQGANPRLVDQSRRISFEEPPDLTEACEGECSSSSEGVSSDGDADLKDAADDVGAGKVGCVATAGLLNLFHLNYRHQFAAAHSRKDLPQFDDSLRHVKSEPSPASARVLALPAEQESPITPAAFPAP